MTQLSMYGNPCLASLSAVNFLPLLTSQALNLQRSGAQELQIALAASQEVAAVKWGTVK
jgi:hypothetical protein